MKTWTAVKEIPVGMPPIESYGKEELERMAAAGNEIAECYRVLEKGDLNLVGEVLKGQGTFFEDDHYPDGDVYDSETHSQYYYHAHRGLPGEHGHFHTFLRAEGIPADIEPVPYDGEEPWPQGEDCIAHLAAISMDRSGFPLGFFMTNRWVTGENWYDARKMSRLARGFFIDHAYPSWPVNRWMSAMLTLFLPQIDGLYVHRDRVVEAWAEIHPKKDVYEDRELDATGWVRVSVDRQVETVRRLLAGRQP